MVTISTSVASRSSGTAPRNAWHTSAEPFQATTAVPAQSNPVPALDLYQVLDTSDVPGGVVNIVTGPRAELADTLAKHDDVAALWVFGEDALCRNVEEQSAGNLKPVWTEPTIRDWSGAEGQSRDFLRRAVQVKTVWVPYGA